MKCIVIGLGSMGKRRIRLIQQIDKTIIIKGVDTREDRRNEVAELYGIDTVDNLDKVFEEKIDCAFVCTSPLTHADIIKVCLENGVHVFTEINLVSDKYDENISLANEKGLTLFLSSTPIYRAEVCYITEQVRQYESTLTYTYRVGQYLPDWHPWENYTDYFIGDSRTNGCREIMAIDLPWVYKTFGPIKEVHVKKGKKTALKTTYPDSYLLLIEHENGTQGTFVLDVVARKAVTAFEVFGEDLYIAWNGQTDGLWQYDIESKTEKNVNVYDSVDKQSGYAAFIVENAYRTEIETFFGILEGESIAKYSMEDDKYILDIIDRIENS